MDLTVDIHDLRQRRDELEMRMRQPGGVRIIEERELLQIRQRLQDPRLQDPRLQELPRLMDRSQDAAGRR